MTDRHSPATKLTAVWAAALAAPILLGATSNALAVTYSFTQLHSSEKSEASGELGTSSEASAYAKEESSDSDSRESNYSDLKESDDYGSKVSDYADSKESDDAKWKELNQGRSEKYGKPSSQLKVDVWERSADSVAFTFYNDGGDKSSITDIYFSGTGGTLDLPGKITEMSEGVAFSLGSNPPNLPGGQPYDFKATVSAGSKPPVMANGINTAKEFVSWTFGLAKGASYKSVLDALDSGTLRIGLFVPGAGGGSASFLNTCSFGGCGGGGGGSVASVPLPASLWLMVGALGGLGFLSRRKRASSAGVFRARSRRRPV